MIAATLHGNVSVLERLVKHEEIEINKAGKVPLARIKSTSFIIFGVQDNKTALFIACQKGLVTLAGILLKHPDIDVNTQDKVTQITDKDYPCNFDSGLLFTIV